MSNWTPEELQAAETRDEVQVAPHRSDGTLRPATTIWLVRLGDDIYVRSAYGPENGWFRRARAVGTGHISLGDVEKDVTFTTPDDDVREDLDEAYHRKYDRFGDAIVSTVVGDVAATATLRLDPR